jgi:hypothetical protein
MREDSCASRGNWEPGYPKKGSALGARRFGTLPTTGRYVIDQPASRNVHWIAASARVRLKCGVQSGSRTRCRDQETVLGRSIRLSDHQPRTAQGHRCLRYRPTHGSEAEFGKDVAQPSSSGSGDSFGRGSRERMIRQI